MTQPETEKSDADSHLGTNPVVSRELEELEREKSQSSDFPDGGARAWLVAAGAATAFFCTLGFTNSFGVFQAYYQFHQMPNEPADNIAWIGGIQAFLIFAVGSVAGPLFDRYGTWVRTLPLPVPSITLSTGTNASICHSAGCSLVHIRHNDDEHLQGVLAIHARTGNRHRYW